MKRTYNIGRRGPDVTEEPQPQAKPPRPPAQKKPPKKYDLRSDFVVYSQDDPELVCVSVKGFGVADAAVNALAKLGYGMARDFQGGEAA